MDTYTQEESMIVYPQALRIKYDLKDLKLYKSMILVFIILIPVSFVSLIMGGRISRLFLILGSVFWTGPFVLVAMIVNYIRSTQYLKRLEIYGYMLPYDKREHHSSLLFLPRNEEKYNAAISGKQDSIRLSIACIAISILLFVSSVNLFIFRNGELGDDRYMLFAIWNAFTVLSGLFSIRYYRESDDEKYRDDVVTDLGRKARNYL